MSECLLGTNPTTGQTIQKWCLAGCNFLTPEGLCASGPFPGVSQAVAHPHIWRSPETPLDPAGKLQGHRALFFMHLNIRSSERILATAWHTPCLKYCLVSSCSCKVSWEAAATLC